MTEKFRTQVPNIIDDLGLDPFERALYVHYKRVCGNNEGGYSNETVATIHKKIKMSAGQVSQARKTLAERGLIRMQDTRPVVVTIVDIWDLNRVYYELEREFRPDIDGWNVEQLRLWLSDIHTVKLSSHNDDNTPSPDETKLPEDNKVSTDIHHMNEEPSQFHPMKLEDDMSTQFHTVKQRSIESSPLESLKDSLDSSPNGEGDKSPPPLENAPIPESGQELEQPSGEPQNPAQKRNRGKKPQGVTSDIPAAIKVYQVIARRLPDKAIWPDIENKVGSAPECLERWGKVITAYIGCGWNKLNLSGMLRFYEDNRIPSTEPVKNGVYTNGAHSKHNQRKIRSLERTGAEAANDETYDISTGERILPDGTRIPAT